MQVSKPQLYLSVKDHSVSNEYFELYLDSEIDMLRTDPQPEGAALSAYYESDDYISHTDSKRSMFERVYHLIRNISLKKKLRLIESQNPRKGKLLDIGAGTGDFLHVAQHNGWNTIGIEPNEKARNIAEKKGIAFTEQTSSFEDDSFDVITMWHVLEHVPDPKMQLAELKRLLKPDGTIIIAVPNFRSFDAKHYGAFWAAYDVPRHLWHFSKTAIASLAKQNNLKLQKVHPMLFDSFYVSLLSEKYKNGKMNFLKAFYIGMLSNVKGQENKEYSSHIYVIKHR